MLEEMKYEKQKDNVQEEKLQEEKQQEEKQQEEKQQEEKLQEEKQQEEKQKENKQEEHKIEIALIEKETEQNVQQEELQQEKSQQEELQQEKSQQEESQQEESQQEESQQEEFPPPPLFLLDGEFPVMGNGTKLDDLEYESVSLPSNGGSITTIQQNIDESAKLDRNANTFPKQESPLTETDKTAIEIEKLHAQIRRMRNSQKKKEKSQNRNTWHPGSLVFVPKNTNTTHKDIEVAPTTGIELSNDGEIKRNKQKPNKETTNEQPAPRGRPTLPSYYKKFLGVNAFTAGEEKK
uniref:SUN domain-containing protein 2-like n=2 Tax=Ciona intestinalis TaxID=7719 RepID=F6VK70_CIOIN